MDIRDGIPKGMLIVLKQLYELEQKLKKQGDPANLGRNVGRMKDALAEEAILVWDADRGQRPIGLVYEDPMGQMFKETRTDLEARISGSGTENLIVVEVHKPIIRVLFKDSSGEFSKVLEKGIVIVESQKEKQGNEQND